VLAELCLGVVLRNTERCSVEDMAKGKPEGGVSWRDFRVLICQPARAEAMVALLRHDRGRPCSGGLMKNRVKVT
jgi:hypothetical protein